MEDRKYPFDHEEKVMGLDVDVGNDETKSNGHRNLKTMRKPCEY
jgi:hypothetical protein